MSSINTKTGRDAIAAAFISAYEVAENTGSKIAEVCKLASQTYKGKPVPEDDAAHIAEVLASARGWEGNTAKVRKSECRKVLGVYSVLPEGIEQVRKERGACNWRDALALSTQLAKHDGKLKPALAALATKRESGTSTPQGRAAGALKAWYKNAKSDKRAKILEAAAILGLKLGVKRDA
jgi:hypothetical protein